MIFKNLNKIEDGNCKKRCKKYLKEFLINYLTYAYYFDIMLSEDKKTTQHIQVKGESI